MLKINLVWSEYGNTTCHMHFQADTWYSTVSAQYQSICSQSIFCPIDQLLLVISDFLLINCCSIKPVHVSKKMELDLIRGLRPFFPRRGLHSEQLVAKMIFLHRKENNCVCRLHSCVNKRNTGSVWELLGTDWAAVAPELLVGDPWTRENALYTVYFLDLHKL